MNEGNAEPTGPDVGRSDANASESDGTPEPGPVRTPSRRILVKWTGQILVLVAVLSVASGFAAATFAAVDLWMAAAFGGGIAVIGLLWVLLRYRAWSFQIRGDHIYLERGVYRHVETVVPYVRIQHVDTSRGPVSRVLGLSTLVVYTAGSRGADVAIPGLPRAEAQDLQRRVKELAIAAGGDQAL